MHSVSEEVILLQAGEVKQTGVVTITTSSRAQAIKRGFMACGACWALAIGALPIPLVHFFVVPAALLLGPVVGVVFFKIYLGARDIAAGHGPCPQCGQRIELPQQAEKWPLRLACSQCQTPVMVSMDQPGVSALSDRGQAMIR